MSRRNGSIRGLKPAGRKIRKSWPRTRRNSSSSHGPGLLFHKLTHLKLQERALGLKT